MQLQIQIYVQIQIQLQIYVQIQIQILETEDRRKCRLGKEEFILKVEFQIFKFWIKWPFCKNFIRTQSTKGILLFVVSDQFIRLSKSEVGEHVLKLKRMTVEGGQKQNEEGDEEEESERRSRVLESERAVQAPCSESVREVMSNTAPDKSGFPLKPSPSEKHGGGCGGLNPPDGWGNPPGGGSNPPGCRGSNPSGGWGNPPGGGLNPPDGWGNPPGGGLNPPSGGSNPPGGLGRLPGKNGGGKPLSQTNGELEPTIGQMIKKVALKKSQPLFHLEFEFIFPF